MRRQPGTLDIVVGGDKEDYDKATELFDAYCLSYKYVGPSGTGHLIKLAINFISLTEALMFAQLFPLMDKMGFDPKDLFDVFEDSVLKNWTSTFLPRSTWTEITAWTSRWLGNQGSELCEAHV